MPSLARHPLARAVLAIAGSSLSVGLVSEAATAQPREDLSVVTRLAGDSSGPAPSFALRIDNYVDVVDSVLNARVRQRRDVPPESPSSIATGVHTPGTTQVAALDTARHRAAPDREDTLFVRRRARGPRLPDAPLIVRTTAAFTGTGAPAGSATWPPPRGTLSISAADGSRIELDAETGDIASVNVRIASGGAVHVFREPWSTWAPLVLNDR